MNNNQKIERLEDIKIENFIWIIYIGIIIISWQRRNFMYILNKFNKYFLLGKRF